MYKEMPMLKKDDWSLNLEDAYYEEHQEEIFKESIEAVLATRTGCYVNIVTPEKWGDPRDWLSEPLREQLKEQDIHVSEIRYVDQCGCGGHVLRIYR